MGHGLTFCFGNDLIMGAVDHDGDAGVFVSIDVVELLKSSVI